MEIKVYKNTWGYDVVDCPFCDYTTYAREGKNGADQLSGLKRHITNSARTEAIQARFFPEMTTKHLEYYVNHTKEAKPVVKVEKRVYDDDLKLTK